MKSFLLMLILVSAITQDSGVAFGKAPHSLPRLSVLSLNNLRFTNVETSSLYLPVSLYLYLTDSVAEAATNKNRIVIYPTSIGNHLGMLVDSNDKEFAIVNIRGEKLVIDEYEARPVIIRDSLPSNLLGQIFDNRWSKAITAEYADSYLGAYIAFTYQEKNHLGLIEEIYFDESGQGQGTIVVNTISGDKLHITSGKRGKPVVVDPTTNEISKEKFRGVVFVPAYYRR